MADRVKKAPRQSGGTDGARMAEMVAELVQEELAKKRPRMVEAVTQAVFQGMRDALSLLGT